MFWTAIIIGWMVMFVNLGELRPSKPPLLQRWAASLETWPLPERWTPCRISMCAFPCCRSPPTLEACGIRHPAFTWLEYHSKSIEIAQQKHWNTTAKALNYHSKSIELPQHKHTKTIAKALKYHSKSIEIPQQKHTKTIAKALDYHSKSIEIAHPGFDPNIRGSTQLVSYWLGEQY